MTQRIAQLGADFIIKSPTEFRVIKMNVSVLRSIALANDKPFRRSDQAIMFGDLNTVLNGLWSPSFIIENVVRWHDAQLASGITTSGATATAWGDKSPNGNLFQELTIPPNYSDSEKLNGFKVIDCGPQTRPKTTDSKRLVWSTAITTAKAVFCVVGTGLDSENRGGGFLFGSSGSTYPFHRGGDFGAEGSKYADSILHSTYGDSNLRTGTVKRNGSVISPTASGFSGENTYDIFSFISASGAIDSFNNINDDRSFTRGGGKFAEFIILDVIPDTTLIAKIEGYLAWRWGLQGKLPSGHAYKSAAPLMYGS